MSYIAQNAINEKISGRFRAEQAPPMALDARAVETRYTLMPILDPRRHMSPADVAVPGLNLESGLGSFLPNGIRPSQMNELPPRQQVYDMTAGFVPIATARGPWSGYAANIDTETALRGQTFALSRCPQAGFVPHSTDRMYDQAAQAAVNKGGLNGQQQNNRNKDRKGPRPMSESSRGGVPEVGATFIGFNKNDRALPDPRA